MKQVRVEKLNTVRKIFAEYDFIHIKHLVICLTFDYKYIIDYGLRMDFNATLVY